MLVVWRKCYVKIEKSMIKSAWVLEKGSDWVKILKNEDILSWEFEDWVGKKGKGVEEIIRV